MTEIFDHSFGLDSFQIQAAEAIARGENVLVSAPTGAGKTVVAEHAVTTALSEGRRCFYTAPIKALSNQKFNDLVGAMGTERVGLLTGDHSINPMAPVVVMTTEVLRNMAYSNSMALDDLGWVVLDEVHFLADAYRGPVWEEVLIHTPRQVRFVCLSATVSNATELGEWIQSLRGPTSTVIEHERPVRLDSVLMVGDRLTDEEYLVPLLQAGRPNPEGRRFDLDRPTGMQGRRPRSRFFTPRRTEVVERLRDEGLVPAIYFIFSRRGCDEAAERCSSSGLRLTSSPERERIRQIVEARTEQLSDDDLDVLGFDRWLSILENGIAAHHAGMVPAFREAVELCFVEGLIKVVFATETLAMGINMPAKSVVIEKLSKFNGETHEPLTAGTYTQLTGRAGRRGIDTRGHAVVLWSPFSTFDQVAELAASREFPLQSSFRPNYNMAANLIDRYDREQAFEILALSFAQFQSNRSAHTMALRRERLRDELETEMLARQRSTAEQVFDVEGYTALLDAIESQKKDRRRRRFETDRFLSSLRPGDVLAMPIGRGAGSNTTNRTPLAVVITVSTRRGGTTRVGAVDRSGRRFQVDHESDWALGSVVGRIDLPVPYLPKDREFRKQAALRLERLNLKRLGRPRQRPDNGTRETLMFDLQARLEEHPLHHHPERSAILEAHRRTRKLRHRLERLDSEIERSGETIAGQLEAILEVLDETDHVDGWALTEAGVRLRRIFHECDLLISLAVGEGLLDELEPAEIAALMSCFSYEHRSSDPAPEPVIPTLRLRERYPRLLELWRRLEKLERRFMSTTTREPQGGFMSAAWSWAAGQELNLIIDEDLSGGDFVRNMRQLIDLLEQVAEVCPEPSTAAASHRAGEALRRGVVLSAGGTL